jgi:hypothetical protein
LDARKRYSRCATARIPSVSWASLDKDFAYTGLRYATGSSGNTSTCRPQTTCALVRRRHGPIHPANKSVASSPPRLHPFKVLIFYWGYEMVKPNINRSIIFGVKFSTVLTRRAIPCRVTTTSTAIFSRGWSLPLLRMYSGYMDCYRCNLKRMTIPCMGTNSRCTLSSVKCRCANSIYGHCQPIGIPSVQVLVAYPPSYTPSRLRHDNPPWPRAPRTILYARSHNSPKSTESAPLLSKAINVTLPVWEHCIPLYEVPIRMYRRRNTCSPRPD